MFMCTDELKTTDTEQQLDTLIYTVEDSLPEEITIDGVVVQEKIIYDFALLSEDPGQALRMGRALRRRLYAALNEVSEGYRFTECLHEGGPRISQESSAEIGCWVATLRFSIQMKLV